MPEFDQYADEYSRLLSDPIRDKFAPGSKFFFERKWQLLSAYCSEIGLDPKSSSWLDVGCGAGQLLALGASSFGRTAGCDVSSGMLSYCPKNIETAVQNDPGKLPFGSGEFDVVTAVCVYHHVPPEARPALTLEVARVLRPGGTACIIEHNPFNPATRLIVSRTPVDADAQLLTSGESMRLLRGAGLGNSSTTFFLYFPETVYRKLAWVESALSGVPLGGQYASFGRKPN
jgi:SAM-dependent methyltransferase